MHLSRSSILAGLLALGLCACSGAGSGGEAPDGGSPGDGAPGDGAPRDGSIHDGGSDAYVASDAHVATDALADGSSDGQIVATNTAPVADAGPDLFGYLDFPIEIVGTGSDGDGDALSYVWTIDASPVGADEPVLDGVHQAIVSFTASTAGTYTLRLIVSDGIDAATDTMTVTVVGPAPVPTAVAGSDQQVAPAAVTHLDGTGSTDPDSLPLTYRWTQIFGADVTGGTGYLAGETPSFNSPTDIGALVFSLVVNNGYHDSPPDFVTILVSESAGHAFLFVATSGDDNAPGTMDEPLQTVTKALELANLAGGGDVYV